MRVSAIVVAAGSGSRLGFDEPKAFVSVGGRAMLTWSIATIARVRDVFELVVAVPPGTESKTRAHVSAAAPRLPAKIAPGGAARQDSVRIALALTSAEADLVIVHDAARPFAHARLFQDCIEAAVRVGGAIAGIPVADTLKAVSDRTIQANVARTGLWQAQTPQVFRRDLLVRAHDRALKDGVVATDDSDLVERIGVQVEIVKSSPLNLKITTAPDLQIAEALAPALRG